LQTKTGSRSSICQSQITGHESLRPRRNYMLARYYAAGSGRFLQVDPGYDYKTDDPVSFNLYSYVRENPVVGVDPDGLRLYAFENGQTITVDDGIDEVYAVTQDGCTPVTDTDGNAMTQHDFLDFVATVYAESGSTGDQSENNAIADVVVNRAKYKNSNISDVIHKGNNKIGGGLSDTYDKVLNRLEGKTKDWISGKKQGQA